MTTIDVFRRSRRPWHALAAAGLIAFATAAQSQAHEQRSGDLVLRGSTVASDAVAAATLQAHGIEPAANRALLNVVVLRREGDRSTPVRADVEATATDLAGKRRAIEMKEVAEAGGVSYLGSYEFGGREVLDFSIVARPAGAAQPIELTFRDRLARR